MSTALALADLNVEINHEPRVLDLRLAEALGFADQHKIRGLVDRHRLALERFGAISATVAENTGRRGRPGKTYWLNKRQALFICTKSEAPLATETTIQMVEVFDAWQAGRLEALTGEVGRGFFRLRIGIRDVLVDASVYQIGRGDEAVVCGHDGKISILRGPLELSSMYGALGKRSVAGPWRKSKARGAVKERSFYTVLGRVVSSTDLAPRPKPVKVRAYRRALPNAGAPGAVPST